MTRDEAKVLLGATRPHDEALAREAEDGEIFAAFEALRADETLRHWYQAECALDEAIGERLRGALGTPPAFLRESLVATLASGRAPEAREESDRGKAGLPLRHWMAMAAGILLLGAVGLALRDGWWTDGGTAAVATAPSPPLQAEGLGFVAFRESMSDYANGKIKLAIKDEDTVALVNWVVENSGPAFDSLPAKMTALAGIGCTVIEWDGRKVSLFCFRNTTNGHVAHLFVIDRKAFRELPQEETLRSPQVCCGLESVAWNDKGRLCLLVAHEPNLSVSEFF